MTKKKYEKLSRKQILKKLEHILNGVEKCLNDLENKPEKRVK